MQHCAAGLVEAVSGSKFPTNPRHSFHEEKNAKVMWWLSGVVTLAACKPSVAWVVACAGDSITAGQSGYISSGPLGTYPFWLESLMAPNTTVSNLGVSGATAMSTGRAYRLTSQYETLLTSAWDAAIVTLGTNDAKVRHWSAARFESEYGSLLSQVAKARPSANVLVGLPPAYLGPGLDFHVPWASVIKNSWGSNATINRAMRDAAIAVADRAQLVTVDFFAALGADPSLYFDPIHPNSDGYRRMALAAYEALSNIT